MKKLGGVLLALVFLSNCSGPLTVSDPNEYVKKEATISTKLLFEKKDINSDHVPEKFISPEVSCGTGGCSWFVFQKKDKEYKLLGHIFGQFNSLKILPKLHHHFHDLRIYHHMSAKSGIMIDFEFNGQEYIESFSKEITSEEYPKYFK